MCVDNVYPGQSKVLQAGRGAFASRKIKNGQLISPMPVMHMSKNAFRLFNNEQVIGTQLMLNYVFGHEKSSLALLPYSPIVNFVNNHVDKSKVNARIQWSTHKYHDKSWEDKYVEYILGQDHAGLMLELVTTKFTSIMVQNGTRHGPTMLRIGRRLLEVTSSCLWKY